METRTLLLNSWMAPHAVLDWQEAISLVYQGKVDVLEEYDSSVSSPSTTYFIPAVLRLRRSVAKQKKGVKFSRLNVFTRDGFRCQYCGDRKGVHELNYDHVVPRRLGGKTVWDNIVTACYSCNGMKGGRTPEQAGMKLLRRPAKPHSLPLHAVYLNSGREIPDPWKAYLDLTMVREVSGGILLAGVSAA